MSERELYEWYEYYSHEPFMADRLEMQLATIGYLSGAAVGAKGQHSDYMISVKKEKEKPKNDAKAVVDALVSAFG